MLTAEFLILDNYIFHLLILYKSFLLYIFNYHKLMLAADTKYFGILSTPQIWFSDY